MITASIVTYRHSKEDLIKVLVSVVPSAVDRIYIVDNSEESLLADLQNMSSKIEYIFNNKNIGFGAAHNLAIKRVIAGKSEFHVILNPDVSFEPSSIADLLSFTLKDENIGLVMPKILYPNGNIQYLCKLLPTPLDWIGRRFIPFRGWVNRRNQRFELHMSGYDKIMNIPYLSGCFMFFRVEALKKVGLFDEKIFMYGEDTDLTRRIHKFYKTLFFPDVVVYHEHNQESYRSFRLLWIHIKASVYYFNKWGWLFDSERKKVNRELVEKFIKK